MFHPLASSPLEDSAPLVTACWLLYMEVLMPGFAAQGWRPLSRAQVRPSFILETSEVAGEAPGAAQGVRRALKELHGELHGGLHGEVPGSQLHV